VATAGDTLDEPDETFKLVLSSPVNTTLATTQGVCTIADNDPAASGATVENADEPAAASVQFSEGVYEASESAGSVRVTVTRTGDTSEPLSVDYESVDGTAGERSDYHTTIGTLSFAPGETSQGFDVLLTDDAHAEGEESFSLHLSNPSGGRVSLASGAEVKIADNDDSASSVNPLEDVFFFVRQQYVDLLGREPDVKELYEWAGKINACRVVEAVCGREAVAVALTQTDEYQSRGLLIYGMYRLGLGRLPRYREFAREMWRLGGGSEEERAAKLRQWIEEWPRRADVRARDEGSTDGEYVAALEAASGLRQGEQLIGQLERGEKTRAEVLAEVVQSAGWTRKEHGRAAALLLSFSYLRREPEPMELDLWLKGRDSIIPGDVEMTRWFITSEEYRSRFGRAPGQ
jgi:hypothetical protein